MDQFRYRAKNRRKKDDLYFLQKVSLVGIVLLVSMSLFLGDAGKIARRYTDHILSAILPGTIVELTNTEREQVDAPELSRSSILDEAARLKAQHMIEEEYFAHFSPEDNISPWHWLETAGYDHLHAGENLAIYFNNSTEVVKAWMNSPLHRENILREKYTEIGVAALEGVYKGHETVYVVQFFGTPMPTYTPPEASPEEDTVSESESPSLPETVSESETDLESETTFEPEPTSTPELSLVAEAEAETESERDSVQGENTEDTSAPEDEEDRKDVKAEKNADPIQIDITPAGDGFAYISGHFATSSIVLPATGISPGSESGKTWLQLIYIALATFVGLSLLSSILLSISTRMHIQLVQGAFLLAILVSEIYIHFQYVIN